jgi:hypothetical protein
MVERGQEVALRDLEARQVERRQLGFDEAVAAFLSDHQAPAEGVECAVGICIAERGGVGSEHEGKRPQVPRCLGGLDKAVRGSHRLLNQLPHTRFRDQIRSSAFSASSSRS